MRVIRVPALVVGTGCAGYNAADWLYDCGVRGVAIATEGRRMGASRNTGSDKQTYYKLSLCSDDLDSVYEMARDLFDGGGVNGDTALCEAAGSVRAFMKLNLLGVPFPTNRYGEYVGYRTDHDARRRATSAGPLTSKMMTEALERAVLDKGIPVYDHMQAVRLVVAGGRVHGLLALDTSRVREPERGLTLYLTPNVVLCTGGPAIAYEKSVYPASQTGCTGMALAAGAQGCNLHQWQYGLASVGFRWNVSGTYQQALPRYISVDAAGVEREFLPEYFGSAAKALDMTFLKGYQWPFDSAKMEGSSLVDLIVYHETEAMGRRVFLDFTRDPAGLEAGFGALGGEARAYLERSGALVKTPVERLRRMNPQAIALYRDHGIDLTREGLEIQVCAQHNNGGLNVDADWQSAIAGLYVAGEAAGTFGAARPGGAALNSTQVGAQRAAEHIAFFARRKKPDEAAALGAAERFAGELERAIDPAAPDPLAVRRAMQARMSRCAAQIRVREEMRALAAEIAALPPVRARDAEELPAALKTQDMLVVQAAMLSAMQLAAEQCGSQGAALVLDPQGNPPGLPGLAPYAFAPAKDPQKGMTLRTDIAQDGAPHSRFAPVRPLEKTDDWFETTWQAFQEARGGKRPCGFARRNAQGKDEET